LRVFTDRAIERGASYPLAERVASPHSRSKNGVASLAIAGEGARASAAAADPEPAVELGLLPLIEQIRGRRVGRGDIGGAGLTVANRRAYDPGLRWWGELLLRRKQVRAEQQRCREDGGKSGCPEDRYNSHDGHLKGICETAHRGASIARPGKKANRPCAVEVMVIQYCALNFEANATVIAAPR
jgi:hypothetical protein